MYAQSNGKTKLLSTKFIFLEKCNLKFCFLLEITELCKIYSDT
jgi:hypothetical protein